MIGIQRHVHLCDEAAEPAWKTYVEAFDVIDYLAAQRHLMTRDEFDVVASDERIVKYLAVDPDMGSDLLGIAVQTNDLEAWPLISPRYFEHRWPDAYARRSIWYIGFVGGVGAAPAAAFSALIDAMVEDGGPGAIGVMDFSGYNMESRHLLRAVRMRLHRLDPDVRAELVDAQTFVAFHFSS